MSSGKQRPRQGWLMEWLPYGEAIAILLDRDYRNDVIADVARIVDEDASSSERIAGLAALGQLALAFGGAPMGLGTSGTRRLTTNMARAAVANPRMRKVASKIPGYELALLDVDDMLRKTRVGGKRALDDAIEAQQLSIGGFIDYADAEGEKAAKRRKLEEEKARKKWIESEVDAMMRIGDN